MADSATKSPILSRIGAFLIQNRPFSSESFRLDEFEPFAKLRTYGIVPKVLLFITKSKIWINRESIRRSKS